MTPNPILTELLIELAAIRGRREIHQALNDLHFPKTEQPCQPSPGCRQSEAAPEGLGSGVNKPLMRTPRGPLDYEARADLIVSGDNGKFNIPIAVITIAGIEELREALTDILNSQPPKAEPTRMEKLIAIDICRKGPGVKTITDNERLQLIGLLTLSKRHIDEMKQIEKAAYAITGETNDIGHTSDAVWDHCDADELLRKLNAQNL